MTCPLTPNQIKWLLDELCVGLGCCLPREGQHYIRSNPPSSIDEFADVVMIEEGMSPERYPEQRQYVRAMVARHFAASGAPDAA
jgi:hypothetical protein